MKVALYLDDEILELIFHPIVHDSQTFILGFFNPLNKTYIRLIKKEDEPSFILTSQSKKNVIGFITSYSYNYKEVNPISIIYSILSNILLYKKAYNLLFKIYAVSDGRIFIADWYSLDYLKSDEEAMLGVPDDFLNPSDESFIPFSRIPRIKNSLRRMLILSSLKRMEGDSFSLEKYIDWNRVFLPIRIPLNLVII